jgi:hypothetical protein
VLPPLSVLSVSNPTVLLSKNGSGGGGDDLAELNAQPTDSQPMAPAAPADPATPAPATPAPKKANPTPAPKMTDPAPGGPDAVDAVFLQVESVPGLAPARATLGVLDADGEFAFRSDPTAVVLGLAAALTLLQLGQPSQPDEDERRRLCV